MGDRVIAAAVTTTAVYSNVHLGGTVSCRLLGIAWELHWRKGLSRPHRR